MASRGAWNGGGTYHRGDVVFHAGKKWRAFAASSNVEPGSDGDMAKLVWLAQDDGPIEMVYVSGSMLAPLLAEIEAGGYECQAGALANNVAWRRLRQMAGGG